MKVTFNRARLKKANSILQKRADVNYRQLLLSLCRSHRSTKASNLIYPILRLPLKGRALSDSSVVALMDAADSLSRQKYQDSHEHFVANQFSLLIRKYPFPDRIFDPEGEAVRKFMGAEHRCSRVNQRFTARQNRKGKPWPYEKELNRMRSFIAYAIGERPVFSSIFDRCGFGPGASIGVHGNATNVARKLLADWSVTPGAYLYAFHAIMNHAQVREVLFPNPGGFTSNGDDWDPFEGPFHQKVRIVHNNKIAFVPKTAKTHRSIAVEPLLNGFLQKGVDLTLRNFLRRVGIDLSNQEINSNMARLGSRGGLNPFATIDLSSASDSLSTQVVRELLPYEWYLFLDAIRSKHYSIDGEQHRFSKFCSMGNGFCFPLETLIFVAACVACDCGKPGVDFRVYGDDIIVKQDKFESVVTLLGYLGFSCNTLKTFNEGPFRESCGGDWFDGEDVRPFTLDYKLDSIESIFKILNASQLSERISSFFEGSRKFLLELVPPDLLFTRPYPGPEATAVTVSMDEFMSSPFAKFSRRMRNWSWLEFDPKPLEDREILLRAREECPAALVFAALTGSASSMPFTVRRETRTKVRRVSHPGATSQWLPATYVYTDVGATSLRSEFIA